MLNRVEIDGDAMRHNVRSFRDELGPERKLGAVVKSNAYGHGMELVAGVAAECGADWLCVNSLDEGVRLRDTGFERPVLVMGYVATDAVEEAVARDIRLVVYHAEAVAAVAAAAQRLETTARLHLKLETGTNRQGVTEDELPALVELVRSSDGVELEGVTTHYANIEDTTDHRFAEDQVETFARIAADVDELLGRRVPIRHTACSAATLLFRRTQMDLARVGISLYGLWPSRETFISYRERGRRAVELRPVMTWKTKIAQVKPVPKGSFVGYGCSFRTTRDSIVAVLPLGYHEGYDRRLSNTAHVLVRGHRAPVLGRVCMNMCMVDVTDIAGAAVEDDVVLLGSQDGETITAEQIAAWCGTISYEVVSRIHPSLPRVLV